MKQNTSPAAECFSPVFVVVGGLAAAARAQMFERTPKSNAPDSMSMARC